MALLIWAFKQQGTVMSVALLAVCGYVSSMLASIVAGPIVEKLNKKAVMLAADSVCAMTTVLLVILYATGRLEIWHLYLVRALLGAAGAFQSPASAVAVSSLVPREEYMRVSGLQSFSGSLMGVLSPVLGASLLAFGGLKTVLIVDLSTFCFAFITLILLRLPASEPVKPSEREKYVQSLRHGMGFIKENKGVWHILLYQMLINLIAGVAYYSVLGPMILARTGGSELSLGYVTMFIGLGAMTGGLILTVYKPKLPRAKLMCYSYMLSFAMCDFFLATGRGVIVWCAAAFFGNITLPFGDGAMMTLLRENIPINMQGRVFSLRTALVACATTVGYLLGAFVADGIAEAVVMADNPISAALRFLLGTGEGRAMGLVFLITAVTGVLGSLALVRDGSVRALDGSPRG